MANSKEVRKSRVFIGSSSESKFIANALQVSLESEFPHNFHVTTWTQDVSRAGKTLIEWLEVQLELYDFAVLICAADDTIISRGSRYPSFRDNVLFELGLFMGKMGRDRVQLLVPRGEKAIKLPSDLDGILHVNYDAARVQADLEGAIASSAHQLRVIFANIGPRNATRAISDEWKDVYGLTDFRASFLGYPYGPLISGTKDLLIILNDGRSWIDTHRELLAKRIANPKQQTRIALLHPRSDFIETLVRKNRKDKTVQLGDIKRSFESLEDARKVGSRLDVRGHFLFNPSSLFLTEREAIVSPYLFMERGALPLFVFSKEATDAFYQHLRDDALKLFEASEPLTKEAFVQ